MRNGRRAPLAAFVVLLAGTASCATLQQIAALRQVEFDYDRITDVRLAGVAVVGRTAYEDLGIEDVTRIGAALASQNVPLEFVVHVRAENPPSNEVTARLIDLDWTLHLDDRRIVDGDLDREYTFPPGQVIDVPVAVSFDAYDLYSNQAENLYELALSLAGVEGYDKEVRLDLEPTIQTDLGPIRYPQPIVIRRTTGS